MNTLIEIEDAKLINEWLRETYGFHVMVSKPKYRVVWSNDQYENRYGTFDVFVGDLFLREEAGVREIPKYSQFPDCWIVEKLMPNEYPDVFEGDYIYDPFYTFPPDLPLSRRAIELLMAHVEGIFKEEAMKQFPKNQEECDYMEREHLEKEKSEVRDALGNITVLGTSLHDGSAKTMSHPNFDLVKGKES